jgi:DNA-binding response OmpR family regulator
MPSTPLRDALTDLQPFGGSGAAWLDPWPTLLVVDSDEEMLRTLVRFFEKRAFHVAPATTLAEAKTCFRRRKHWTLVVADYHLPDGTGAELRDWVRTQPGVPPPPVLLMSGNPHGESLCAGAHFIAKPFRVETLDRCVRLLLGEKRSG